MVGDIKGDSGASLSTTQHVPYVLMLGNRNIAALEIRGRYPAAGRAVLRNSFEVRGRFHKATTPSLPFSKPVWDRVISRVVLAVGRAFTHPLNHPTLYIAWHAEFAAYIHPHSFIA